jgi:hypothetical protein
MQGHMNVKLVFPNLLRKRAKVRLVMDKTKFKYKCMNSKTEAYARRKVPRAYT